MAKWEQAPKTKDAPRWASAPLARGSAPREGAGPSELEALARGGVQGATLGFSDEAGGLGTAAIQAVANMLPKSLKRRWDIRDASPVDAYRSSRDDERAANKAAEAAHGAEYLGANIAGGFVLPGGQAKGLKQLVQTGLKLGLIGGAGMSDADLTRGEMGRFAGDTALGGAVGAGAGAAGHLLTKAIGAGAGALQRRASRGIREAVDSERAIQTALAEKAIGSQQGGYRGAVANASRDLEVMTREAAALPDGHPVKTKLLAYLQSPEAIELRAQVAANKLETAPERISEMSQKLGGLKELVAGKAANVEAQTAEGLAEPGRRHLLPKARTLASRAMPLALGAIGHTLGGVEGAAVGAGLGTIMSMTQGAPGRIVRNLYQKPAVRKAFWEQVRRGAAPLGSVGGLGGAAAPLGRALAPDIEESLVPAIAESPEEERRRALVRALAGG